jgi:hypothetical protein
LGDEVLWASDAAKRGNPVPTNAQEPSGISLAAATANNSMKTLLVGFKPNCEQ